MRPMLQWILVAMLMAGLVLSLIHGPWAFRWWKRCCVGAALLAIALAVST